MISPDLNAMALFVRVIDFKSFSEASKRLAIPLSTVSRKVSELEKFLGVRLIERSTRHLRLTDLGQEYYQYCRRGLEEFETGALIINNRQSEVSGTLRISIPPNITDVLVTPIVCSFQNSYPKTSVKILVTERNVDLIEDGVDIALRVGELKDSSLVARRLFSYRHILVASPTYLEQCDNPHHPNDLIEQQHRLISFSGWQGQILWEFESDQQQHKIAIESTLSINEMTGVQYAAEAGLGIAEIPAIICAKALQEGILVEVMPNWRFKPTILSVIYPSKRNTSRLVKLFMDNCFDYIEKYKIFTGF
ncbi:MAG: LysR substrate-binding domain-containing protein [Gammaproteobacteria bacterium]